MRGPGGFSGGKTSDAMVSQNDLFPTLRDLVDVPHPAWLQGRSMLPLIRGDSSPEIREETFAEVNFHVSYEPGRSVRTKRWNYIRRFGDRRLPLLANCDDSPSKDEWLEHGWGRRIQESESLFDLEFDPEEVRNVAGNPALRPVLEDMRRLLDSWMRETADPLLKGPVQPPPGALVGDPDFVSPKQLTRRTA